MQQSSVSRSYRRAWASSFSCAGLEIFMKAIARRHAASGMARVDWPLRRVFADGPQLSPGFVEKAVSNGWRYPVTR
jgi:hypothetical protein